MSYNGYPCYTQNSLIERIKNYTKTKGNYDKNEKTKIIWVTVPYLGHIRD